MKKLLFLGLALFGTVIVSQVQTASASTTDFWGFKVSGWQKYPQPVLPRQPGQWDSSMTREISPIINDTDGALTRGAGGQLTAYYYGADGLDVRQIGKAISTDNGYTWVNRAVAIAPSGVAGSWYQSDVSQPTVIRRVSDGKLFMMATGQQNNDYTTAAMGAFTSTDGGTTWNDQGVQVTKGMFHYENGAAITEFGVPRVIKRSSGDYLLVLEGQQYGSGSWRVFAATSPTFIGNWTAVNSGNPILLPSTNSWENIGVANPQIIEVEPGSYVMAYNGRGTAAPQAWQVGFASSTDLTTWYRNPGNPVLKPGAETFDAGFVETSFLAKGDSYGVPKLYFQAYDANSSPQVGVATADWREFTGSWFGNDGMLYSRRSDSTLLRTSTLFSTQSTYWNQIGFDWNQFSIMFGGRAGDNRTYAVRASDGALLRNLYTGSGWQGWEQIGWGWNQFTEVFMGTDGWIYAVRSDGAFLKNRYVDGVGWQGWTQIGAGWNQFTQVFMNNDGWIYAVRSDGLLFKNQYTDGVGWTGWVHIGSDWNQFTQVFPAAGSDTWIYAMRSDGHFFRNKYVNGTGWLGWQEL